MGCNLQVAVIFHDFHVLVTVAKRRTPRVETQSYEAANDYHEMAVKDLKLSQLQLLRVSFIHARQKFWE